MSGGWDAMLADQRRVAVERGGLPAARVGITSLVPGRALHLAATSLTRGKTPSVREPRSGTPAPVNRRPAAAGLINQLRPGDADVFVSSRPAQRYFRSTDERNERQ